MCKRITVYSYLPHNYLLITFEGTFPTRASATGVADSYVRKVKLACNLSLRGQKERSLLWEPP